MPENLSKMLLFCSSTIIIASHDLSHSNLHDIPMRKMEGWYPSYMDGGKGLETVVSQNHTESPSWVEAESNSDLPKYLSSTEAKRSPLLNKLVNIEKEFCVNFVGSFSKPTWKRISLTKSLMVGLFTLCSRLSFKFRIILKLNET